MPWSPDGDVRGRWYAHAEVGWKRWGLGIEISLGYWWPPEWSAHLHIGPVLMCAGWEEDSDWALWRLRNDHPNTTLSARPEAEEGGG